MGSFYILILDNFLVVLQRLPKLWRRRPKNGSFQVSKKAKDGILKPFHVHAHTEFAFVLNSADLGVFGVIFGLSLGFQLSVSYQFGLLLYFRL